jgi:hypothetical protein
MLLQSKKNGLRQAKSEAVFSYQKPGMSSPEYNLPKNAAGFSKNLCGSWFGVIRFSFP